ncbi:MAG: HEAT repeat domain-containing protein [Verrucomicrobia bacterium]|nr:HEAT repeat domain-containing protein [Verrucomicrobiota bacterium]
MLVDERESDIARLALEPAPGAEVDAALIDALGKTTGRTRIGIILSLTRRAPASAVPALGTLLADKDAATAAAAATALGQVGNAAALAALRTGPATGAVFEAKLSAARKLPAADGLVLLTELQRDGSLAPHQRAAAFRGLLDLDPAAAPARIAEVLAVADWTPKQAALESVVDSRAPGLVPALAAKLSSWDVPTQIAALEALARRGEPAATPALVAASKHADAKVRAAALAALGFMPGDRKLVALLATVSAGENFDDAKTARASLARLNGPGVSEAVLAGAEKGDAAKRAVFIEQLASRNLTEALPFLRACRKEPDAAIRIAAVGALGDLAPVADQAFVLDWASGATDAAEQARALRAVVSVTLRDPDAAKRALPIYAALEKAAPAQAVQLMPLLSRLGGKASAECAARLASGADATVADAATGTLTRWPDNTAQASLVTVAAKAKVESARKSAGQAALRYFERNREVWSAAQTAQVSQLLDGASDAALRKGLVVLLHRASDKDALALAKKLQAEPALADAAKAAELCIAANLSGPPAVRVSEGEISAKNLFDGRTSTQWRVPVTSDQWVEVDFKRSRPLHRLTLDETGRTGDFPERYEVFVTDDLEKPGKPVASGAGQRNRTVIDLPAGTGGRYVIIKNTAERPDGTWAICELFVD